jgi:hypothetical protein
MPIYEYQCDKKHITEVMLSLEQGSQPQAQTAVCMECVHEGAEMNLAQRILSATPGKVI